MPDYNLENRITALEEDNVSIKNRLTTAENSIINTDNNLIQAGTDLTTINNELTTIKNNLNKEISFYANNGLVFQLFKDIGDNTNVELPANAVSMDDGMTFELYTEWNEIPNNSNTGTLCEFTNVTNSVTLLAMILNNAGLEVKVNGNLITSSSTNITVPVNSKHTITVVLSDKTYFYFDGVYAGQSNTVLSTDDYFTFFNNRFSSKTYDSYEGTLPFNYTSEGGKLVDWRIDGSDENTIINETNNLPINITTNNTQNASDFTIYGNDSIGKNLLKNTGTTIERNGVTFTKNADGTVVVNGTSTSNGCIFFVGNVTLEPDKTYIYNGCPAGGGDQTTYCLYFGGRGADWADFGEGKTLPAVTESTTLSSRIVVYNGITVENLVFKPMIRPANTSSTFEPYTVGVGGRTKNLIRVPSIAPVTDHSVTFTFDPVAGTITANGTATGGQGRYAIYIEPSETINVYLSGCPAGGSASSYNVYPWDTTAGARPKKWDGVTSQTDSDYGSGDLEVQILAGHSVSITLRIEQGYTANNVVFKPMYRKSDTTSEFVPYGYEIPLTISQTGQTITNVDLEQGYTGTDTTKTYEQNKQDAANRLRTPTLIDFDSSVQNNITISNGFEFAIRWYTNGLYASATGWLSTYTIPTGETGSFGLTIRHPDNSDITNTESITISIEKQRDTNIYIGNSPLTQGQSITKTSLGTDIALYQGNNTISTTLYNKPKMSLTYVSDDIGIGDKTKNLLKITAETQTINGVTFTVDKIAGTITANGTASANARFDFHTTEMTVNATDIINGIPDGATSSTYYILAEFENGANAFGSNLDNTAIGDRPNFTPRVLNWRIYVISGQTVNNLVFKPMLRTADTDTEFIPYGYKIPISVTANNETTIKDIFIGENRLTAGNSISKTSTNENITLYEGINSIDTLLLNKPNVYFKSAPNYNSVINGTNYNLRIYNRALTSDEIVTNHNADVDRYDRIILPGSKPTVNGYVPISVKVSMTTSATVKAVTE